MGLTIDPERIKSKTCSSRGKTMLYKIGEISLITLLLFTAFIGCSPGCAGKQAGPTDPPISMDKPWKLTVKFKLAAAHFYVYDPMDVTYKDFELPDLSGTKIRLSSFQGKPILLYFWESTSSISKDELPEIEKLSSAMKNEIAVVAVNIGEAPDVVKDFVKKNRLTFTVLLDRQEALLNVYARIRVPSAYIIDPDGYIAGATAGQSYWNTPEMRVMFRVLAKKHEWK
jgi:peroxiredoxin